MRRRTVLRRGAVLAVLGLAGCTGNGGSSTDTAAPATDTRSATPETGPGTAEASPTPSVTPTGSTATSSPPPTTAPATETAGDTPTPSPTPTPTPTPTPSPESSVDQEVAVGPGSLTFEPDSFQIPAGGTVRWVWESSGHNVRPSSTPNGADWTGTEGGDSTTYDAGHTYTYTFEVDGTYDYFCAPHRSAGMTGTFTVGSY